MFHISVFVFWTIWRVLQRKWYRNFLMKGFHVVVLLAAGPGVRDTQVIVVWKFCILINLDLLDFYYHEVWHLWQCGFKMFTRAAARKLFTNIRLKRYILGHAFKLFKSFMVFVSSVDLKLNFVVSIQVVLWCGISLFKQILSHPYNRDIGNLVWNSGIQGKSIKHSQHAVGNDSHVPGI